MLITNKELPGYDDFMRAFYKLSLDEQKLILFIASKLDPENESCKVTISVEEIAYWLNTDKNKTIEVINKLYGKNKKTK